MQFFLKLRISLAILAWCSIFLPSIALAVSTETIDLTEHDFSKVPVVKLDGTWRFYWREFVPPEAALSRSDALLAPTPSSWTTYEVGGHNLPGTGYGTYAVTVNLGANHPNRMSFKFKRIKMAYRLFVNGQLVASNGNPAPSKEETIHFYQPYIADILAPKGPTKMDIVLHIANYKYPRGGIDESVYFGVTKNIYDIRERGIFNASFVAGGLLLMSLYHFGLWALRRNEKSTLVFGLFCLAMSIRMLTTGEKFLVDLIPALSIDSMMGLEIGSVFFGIPILHMFIYFLFPEEFSKKIYWGSMGVCTLLCLTIVFLPLMIFASAILPFEIYVLVMFVHALTVVLHALIRKKQGAFLFLLGFLAIIVAGVNDILFERGIINTTFLLHYGVLIFIFSQSFVLSTKFSTAFNQVEILKNSLEEQVQDRTAELQRLSNRMTNVLEDERKEIAQEIHDNFNSVLVAIKMHSRKLEKILSEKKEDSSGRTIAEKITLIVTDAYGSARKLVRRLRPEIIDTLGLRGALEQLVNGYNTPSPSCVFSSQIEEIGDIDEETKMALYRIAQEALTNVVKHANAHNAHVALSRESEIHLIIRDDGMGFSKETTTDGVGLISMRERVSSLGGQFVIESTGGQGTTIRVSIP